MITFEELKTYTVEELYMLSSWIKEIHMDRNPIIEDFYKNFDSSNLKVVTIKVINEKYIEWCNSNGHTPIDIKIFNKICHAYIKKYNIKLTARVKEIKEKDIKVGDKTSDKEK